ncbi:MAG: SMI1/KNR4 family protein, partial [Planctomycetota bacterium]
IAAAEAELGVPFPAAYRRFLLLAGGANRAPAWRGLWRIDELVSLNRSLPVFRGFGGLLGVGNEGFLVYALDYRAGAEDPPLVSVGLSSSDPSDVSRLAERFEDWLEETLPPP